jgi:hypothetical protein
MALTQTPLSRRALTIAEPSVPEAPTTVTILVSIYFSSFVKNEYFYALKYFILKKSKTIYFCSTSIIFPSSM